MQAGIDTFERADRVIDSNIDFIKSWRIESGQALKTDVCHR